MRQDEVVGRDGRGRLPFPWFGAVLSALMSLLMLGVTAVLWADLPHMVPTGRVGLDGEPSLTTRWIFGTTVPGVALTTVLCVAVGSAFGNRSHTASRLSPFWSGRSARTLMDFLLVLVNVFLLALHTALLSTEAGRPFVPSAERIAPLLVGGLLVGTGLLVALTRARRSRAGPVAHWWERARRAVGLPVSAVGALVIATGLLPSHWAVWPHLTGLLPLAVAVGCAVPFFGNQDWKKQPGSQP